MRTRHKAPMIFTLSMVDVLCCALGCVILLWLLNAKQTEDETEEQRLRNIALMADSQSERSRREQAGAAAKAEQDRLNAKLRSLMKDRDEVVVVNAKLAEQLRLLQQSEAMLKVQLGGEQKLAKDLQEKLKASGIRIVSLEGDVKKTAAALEKEKKGAGAMSVKLVDLETALKKLRGQLVVAVDERDKEAKRAADLTKTISASNKELALLNELLKEMRASKVKLEKAVNEKDADLAAVLKDKKLMEKLLADRAAALKEAKAALTRLEKEKLSALASLTKAEKEKLLLRALADNRFAGIALTGKRALFLVDTSGSMEMIDEKTTAPEKWREVCATVGKLLKSLPDVEKYQVIGFGPELSWPLGSKGKWLDFDEKTSAADAEAALRKVQPNGGTNMFIAMEAAFALRKEGLDTIYVLSDGLPNQGEGVPPDRSNARGMERGLLLAKHIRTTLEKTWNRPQGASKQRVKIHTIGFFYESPDLGSFLWALARENEGSFVGMSRP